MTGKAYGGVLALLVMALTPLLVHAQPGTTGSKDWLRSDNRRQPSAAPVSSRSGIGKTMAVVALIGAGGFVVWRKTRKAHPNTSPTKTHVRVVGGTLVGPKARAVVAEVGGRLILLGVTEQSVRKLAWLDSADEIEMDDEPAADRRARKIPLDVEPQRSTPPRGIESRRRSTPQRSKFSEVLRDAVGIKASTDNDSAIVLAENTHDRVSLSGARRHARDDSALIDIEGQAAGLVSRLNKVK